MDFYEIRVRKLKDSSYEIYPEFLVDESKDLMVRGKDFYAVYDEDSGMWIRDPRFVQKKVDSDIWNKLRELRRDPKFEDKAIVASFMRDSSSGRWDKFIKYVKNLPDSYHQLDEKLTFQDTIVKRTDYVSKRLPYSLRDGDISAYEEIVTTLYSPEERTKFEWAIGSIVAGDSKKIQKFVVFYGPQGTGKSTILNLIEALFGGYNNKKGYCAKINAKALTSNNTGFALEPFAKSPLVGIDQDSKLSRIEDNTVLNQIVSHDTLQINEKFKNLYDASASCFLFMGTNEPVKITDSKSGVIRRLIDVEPTGRLIKPESKYEELVERMNFELGAIAKHCLDVYKKMGKSAYSSYVPTKMIVRTDPFFNFMKDNLEVFILQGGVSANELWDMYNAWCDKSRVDYRMKRYQMVDEAKNYFENFDDRIRINGEQVRNWYSGLKMKKFLEEDKQERKAEEPKPWTIPDWLNLKEQPSILDSVLAEQPAQYGDSKPETVWKNCKTRLKELDTRQTHYVQCFLNLITVDFDKKNQEGEKDLLLNIRCASSYTPTYAEVSKGGAGLHLTYWYDGDPNDLNRIVEPGVEVKVQTGNAALRRRLSLCNNLPIAHISSGLPLREKKVVNDNALKDASHLRTRILKALKKEIEPGFTTTCINYIEAQLKEAQEKNIAYDLMDLDNAIFSFAASSHHNSEACLKKYFSMKLRWPEVVENYYTDIPYNQKRFVPNEKKDAPLVFCDVEVGKNVLLVCYKEAGPNKKTISMFNPTPVQLEWLFNTRLVGFNSRGYDAHILYARYIGYNNYQLWELSQDMIVREQRGPFREAEHVFEIDVYDYSTKKQSLKMWEIELGLPHMEMEVDWAEDIPEENWPKLAEYCCNDVEATEQVFYATAEDFTAREIMCELTGMPLITTTNQLSARYIFGDAKEPWKEFVYPDLTKKFPGYSFRNGKSYYRYTVGKNLSTGALEQLKRKYGEQNVYVNEDTKEVQVEVILGEGGRVYAEPGMYYWVITLDATSLHPSSIVAENGFGPYTKKFKDLMDIRVAIKHKEYDKVKKMYPDLAKYLGDDKQAKALSFALKIVINSVYGLTAAKFQNKFKDPRNIDNWVAKRGALFMETLRIKVQAMGAHVIHIKTDSIKIVAPSKEVIRFIHAYAKDFGYNFEVESIYERICLVNDAVYIAKCTSDECNGDHAGKWTATGAQFAEPYIFKTLFSKEPLDVRDYYLTKQVKTVIYLDMNEKLNDPTMYEKEQTKIEKKFKESFGDNYVNILKDLESNHYEIDTSALEDCRDYIERYKELKELIAKCHNYQFVGRVGLFCPVIKGLGGGLLMRKGTDNRFTSVTGTKGYRWMEAYKVPEGREKVYIDMDYYTELANEAIETINKYGPFEQFVSEDIPPFDIN